MSDPSSDPITAAAPDASPRDDPAEDEPHSRPARRRSDDEPPDATAAPVDASTTAPTANEVSLVLACDDLYPPLNDWLVPRFEAVLAAASVTRGRLTLAVVDSDHMSELHERHVGETGPTDVLTFDLRETADAPLEGDLVLCRDVAGEQASARGHEARLEVLLYAVHGLLHLLGHDDHDPAAAGAMHRREDALLQAIGVGAVYG